MIRSDSHLTDGDSDKCKLSTCGRYTVISESKLGNLFLWGRLKLFDLQQMSYYSSGRVISD